MVKLLVTGGAGFIGSNFIKYIFNKYENYYVINLDKLTYAGNLDNLRELEQNANYSFIKGDICDTNLVNDIFKAGIDYAVNFAAESHVDRSITEPAVFSKTNIIGTQVLLDAARENGVKRYLQVSTDEVYGSLGHSGYFSEESSIAPNSPYSASKASADLLTRAYFKTYGLPVNITRCSNNYGPYQFPEKFIPLMILNTLRDKRLPVYGDGLNIRDWLHVEDHCSALDLVLHKGEAGEIYNIGGSNEKKNIEIARLILNRFGKSESLIKYVKDRLGHDRRYAVDSSNIRKELGWEPKYTFEKGIAETITWYMENRIWWEALNDYKL